MNLSNKTPFKISSNMPTSSPSPLRKKWTMTHVCTRPPGPFGNKLANICLPLGPVPATVDVDDGVGTTRNLCNYHDEAEGWNNIKHDDRPA